jgi:hypothetical protein
MATQINCIMAVTAILQHLPFKFHLLNVNTKQSNDAFHFYFFLLFRSCSKWAYRMSGGLIYCDSKTHLAWMLKSRSRKFA